MEIASYPVPVFIGLRLKVSLQRRDLFLNLEEIEGTDCEPGDDGHN